jgi:hypothetical protein
MAILLARKIRLPEWGQTRRIVLGAVSLTGLLVGFLIIRASAALAEVGREGGWIAAQQRRVHPTVWMDGGWGFQWYAMQAGAQPVATTPPFPGPGDVVVAGLQAKWIRDDSVNSTLLYRHVFDSPGGRVHSEKASFFSNRVRPWPWTWASGELGRIEVWRVDSAK